MKLKSILFSLLILTAAGIGNLFAQKTMIDIDLWPNGLPNTNGVDHLPFDDKSHNYKPSMRVFLPDSENITGRMVLALPGGGYQSLAYHHEGYEWADFFNEQGIAFAVLKYRMPHGNKEVPFSDVEEALRILKSKSNEWGVNREDIGIMGSSAGGHLASTIATKLLNKNRPAFQILFYPVITMNTDFTHAGSRKNLLGENISKEIEVLYSNEKQITKDTPPALILFSDDDKTVPSRNGVEYYLGLKKHNIPASLYIYPSGGHGWGIRDNFTYHDELLLNIRSWLSSF